jgi:hypothetical protein
MSLAKILTAAATVVAVLATPFVTANAAHAKSLKCYSTKVAGTVATYTWSCTTGRP